MGKRFWILTILGLVLNISACVYLAASVLPRWSAVIRRYWFDVDLQVGAWGIFVVVLLTVSGMCFIDLAKRNRR